MSLCSKSKINILHELVTNYISFHQDMTLQISVTSAVAFERPHQIPETDSLNPYGSIEPWLRTTAIKEYLYLHSQVDIGSVLTENRGKFRKR